MSGDNFESLLIHGAEIRQMLVTPRNWVYRRVEQISFVDDQTARRRVSIDFQLRPSYVQARLGSPVRYVPLALLRKGVSLVDFDLCDEEGRALPLVGSERSSGLSGAALVNTASTILADRKRSLGAKTAEELLELAAAEPDEARRIRDALEASGDAGDQLLADDDHMRTLAGDLTVNFLIFTPITLPSRRRVLKFSYLEELPKPSRSLGRVLGWRSTPFQFQMPGVSMARSYHCEVCAPESLENLSAELSAMKEDSEPIVAPTATCGERLHLALPSVPPDYNGVLVAKLRASRRGMPRAAAWLAVGVSLLLTAGVLFHNDIAASGESTTALLVAIPALLAAYLIRPGEHELASRVLVGIRTLTAVIGLLTFLAAASTTLVHHGTEKEAGTDHEILAIWIPIAGLAWLVALMLVLSAILPRPDRRSESSE